MAAGQAGRHRPRCHPARRRRAAVAVAGTRAGGRAAAVRGPAAGRAGLGPPGAGPAAGGLPGIRARARGDRGHRADGRGPARHRGPRRADLLAARPDPGDGRARHRHALLQLARGDRVGAHPPRRPAARRRPVRRLRYATMGGRPRWPSASITTDQLSAAHGTSYTPWCRWPRTGCASACTRTIRRCPRCAACRGSWARPRPSTGCWRPCRARTAGSPCARATSP